MGTLTRSKIGYVMERLAQCGPEQRWVCRMQNPIVAVGVVRGVRAGGNGDQRSIRQGQPEN